MWEACIPDDLCMRLSAPHAASGLDDSSAVMLSELSAWSQMLLLEPLLPNLEELHLCGNSIKSLQPPATTAEGEQQQESNSQPVTGFSNLQVGNRQHCKQHCQHACQTHTNLCHANISNPALPPKCCCNRHRTADWLGVWCSLLYVISDCMIYSAKIDVCIRTACPCTLWYV